MLPPVGCITTCVTPPPASIKPENPKTKHVVSTKVSRYTKHMRKNVDDEILTHLYYKVFFQSLGKSVGKGVKRVIN